MKRLPKKLRTYLPPILLVGLPLADFLNFIKAGDLAYLAFTLSFVYLGRRPLWYGKVVVMAVGFLALSALSYLLNFQSLSDKSAAWAFILFSLSVVFEALRLRPR